MKEINMTKKKWTMYGVLAAAILATAFSTSAFGDDHDDLQDALSEIKALKAEVNTMKADSDSTWMDEERAKEIRSIVTDVLADADTRVSLSAENKDFTLDVNGFAVARWSYNDGGGVSQNNEFSIPYARLQFSGSILQDFGYRVSGEFSDYNSGEFNLLDAYVTADFSGFDFKAGQFVTSFYNGYTDSPLDQVAGEYSVLATTFGQGRSQGVELSRDFGFVNLSASYNDGFDTDNVFINNDDYGASVRADFDFGAGFNAGAAVAYQSLTEDYVTYTVDAGYSNHGWDINASWVSADYTSGGYDGNYGITGLVAYQCTDSVQGFVQYQHGKLGGAGSDLNLAEVGVNYDFNDYVRWTTTVGYALDGVDAGWDLGRSGWSSGDSDGQYLVRTQVSVSF